MCAGLKAQDIASSFKKMVNKRENLETLGGMSTASSEGTTHSVRLEEQLAFSDWINSNLSHDPHLKHLLPIDSEGRYLYDRVKDGILLWWVGQSGHFTAWGMLGFWLPVVIEELERKY